MNNTLPIAVLIILFAMTSCKEEKISNHQERVFENKIGPEVKEKLITDRKLIKEQKSLVSVISDIEEVGPNIKNPISANHDIKLSGMIKELIIDNADSNHLVVATQTSGAWHSLDRGASWMAIDDDWAGISLSWLVQSQTNTNLYYFAAERLGLYIWDSSKSDGLVKWKGTINDVSDLSFSNVYYIKNSPVDSSIHYVSSGEDIYKFSNGSYDRIRELKGKFYAHADFEILPNESIISSTGEILTTLTKDGRVYEFDMDMTLAIGSEIAYSKRNPDIVYAYALGAGGPKIYRSMNGGLTWESASSNPTFKYWQHDQTIEIYEFDSQYDIVIIGGVNFYFDIIANNHNRDLRLKVTEIGHSDYHGTLVENDSLYAYNDGGLFKIKLQDLENDTRDIRSLWQGLNTVQSVDVQVDDLHQNIAFGLWHNGSHLKRLDAKYIRLNSGDGLTSAFHPEQDIVYSSSGNNFIIRRDIDHGNVAVLSTTTNANNSRTEMFTHFTYPDNLYYIDDDINYIENATDCSGSGCTKRKLSSIQPIDGIRYSKSRKTKSIYAFDKQNIYRNDDLHQIPFEDIYSASQFRDFREATFIDLRICESQKEGNFYALIRGIENRQYVYCILEFENGILDEATLVNINKLNVPSGLSITGFAISDIDHNSFLLKTPVGLYSGKLDGDEILPECDIPAVEITDIEYFQDSNVLYMSTYGRGIWKYKFEDCRLSYYADLDMDGYGDLNSVVAACDQPLGFVSNADDCDDNNSDINPDAIEIPNNGIDEDCDGLDLLTSVFNLAHTKVKIYPNPATDIILIDIDGALEFKTRIYTLAGQLIKTSINTNEIQVTELLSGTYLLEIEDLKSRQKVVKKIVIEK